MKCSYDDSSLLGFNEVDRPTPYKLYGKVRYSNLNDVYIVLFARAVWNKTGDCKAHNKEIAKILGITERQVINLINKLEELGQIKTFYMTYYTGGGVRTGRVIRSLAAHAYLNYQPVKRAHVFGRRKGEMFDYSLLDRILLMDQSLRWDAGVTVDDTPIIPEWADDPEYVNKPGFLEAYKPVTGTYENGMDGINKLIEGVTPGFLIEAYNTLREKWEIGNEHAILILGSERGVKTFKKRREKKNEHVSSI